MNIQQSKMVVLGSALAVVLVMALPVRAADPGPAAYAQGAKVWAENCARCHNARDPKDFSDEQWKVIMSHMRIRAGLSGQEGRDVLKFLQGSNARPSSLPRTEPVMAGTSMATGVTGQSLYEGTCIACHGANGKGVIPGVPDFTDAKGRLSQPDGILKKHILEGVQSPGSPMAMPARGGLPSLGEQDVVNLLAYMRARFTR